MELKGKIVRRYFFHLDSDEGCIEDQQGESLGSLAEAAEVGQQTAFELSRNVDCATLVGKSVVVKDENGRKLLEFPLVHSLALEMHGRGKRSSSRFHG